MNGTVLDRFIGDIALLPRDYIEQSLSKNTRRAYQNDIRHFQAWGGTIPASPEVVCSYLADQAGQMAIATISRRLVSITKAHRVAGFASPAMSEAVKLTLRGIRNVHGSLQKQASPLLRDDLVRIVRAMPITTKSVRDSALLLIGFAAALRRSEVASLSCSDIEFVPKGMIITLRRSKIDQAGMGRKIAIPYARGEVCPVLALQHWMNSLPDNDGLLFRSLNKAGRIASARLSDRAISTIIKDAARLIGFDDLRYSGHSLRSGFATSAAQAGVSSWKIRQQTGHKSDAMLGRYIRSGELFVDNAAGSLF